MSLSPLTSAQLHQLIQLVKEKEALQTKLAQVERSLAGLESGEMTKDEGPAPSGEARVAVAAVPH